MQRSRVENASVSLTDNDRHVDVRLSASPASIDEDAAATTVTVTAAIEETGTQATATRDAAVNVAVVVGASGDSATSGTDYAAVADFTIAIPAGQSSATATFTLTPTDDTLLEGNETISLDGTASASLTTHDTSVTLADDDSAHVDLSVSPASVGEAAGADDGDGDRGSVQTATRLPRNRGSRCPSAPAATAPPRARTTTA